MADTLAVSEPDHYGQPPFAEWYKDHGHIHLDTFDRAVEQSDELVFNCTSGMASLKVLEQAGADKLQGKILVDIANPLDFSNGAPPSLNPVDTDSLGEQIQRAFPGLRVVKTLNTMSAYMMVNPGLLSGDHNVFVSGNDAGAKTTVKSLLENMGWKTANIIDLGDISTARGTEMLLPIWLRLWSALGHAQFNFYVQQK